MCQRKGQNFVICGAAGRVSTEPEFLDFKFLLNDIQLHIKNP
jgi:hypothetical protein